jgi:predicted phage-related endonuclease
MAEPTPESTPDPVAVPLDTDMAGWLAAYRRARDKVKHWAATAEAAQKHVTDLLDAHGAGIGTVDGHPAVRWTRVESRRVDGARLRADHPDLADEYSSVVVSRRFSTPNVPTERTVS